MAHHPHYRLRAHLGGERHSPPEVRQVECTETEASLTFDCGRCTAQATADALMLRLEATDEESLRRLEKLVASRVETIGRRDQLTVTWHRTQPPAAPTSQVSNA